jgi:hypothetical protein
METIKHFVWSCAGFGQQVRGGFDKQADAELKAKRLLKKGHTQVVIETATVTGSVEVKGD